MTQTQTDALARPPAHTAQEDGRFCVLGDTTMPATLTDPAIARAQELAAKLTPAERLALLDELTNYDECAEAIDSYIDHDQTPKGWDEVPAYTEIEREAFARGGMTGLNESRGHDSYSPEPCGHHCLHNGCPICV